VQTATNIKHWDEAGVTEATNRAHTAASSQLSWWRKRQNIGLTLALVLLSCCSYTLISNFFVCAVVIQGCSMEPTLQDGNCYLLNRWSYHFRRPSRNEVVVLRDPGHSDCAIKRIVGVPGDAVELRGGRLVLNGQLLSEPYLPLGTRTLPLAEKKAFKLSADEYFVLGDNREESEDSRAYGAVHRSRILGCLAHKEFSGNFSVRR
jgi:signal peptidase I